MSEYITLEFYEVDRETNKVFADEPVMYASDVSFVPRKGDLIHMCRTEKVLGIDPDKEHRYWKVIDVEIWYQVETNAMIKYGTTRQIAVFVQRTDNIPYDKEY